MEKKVRLNRSELAVPGTRQELFEKAANSASDIIFLDLEDSVSLDDKKKARKNVIEAINDIDWKQKTISVRVNSYDTIFIEEDITAVTIPNLLVWAKISLSSTVSPEFEISKQKSSGVIIPKSPWLASVGCIKKAGDPVDVIVDAIFLAIWPDFPTPDIKILPLFFISTLRALVKF